jgi:hypothetical protein
MCSKRIRQMIRSFKVTFDLSVVSICRFSDLIVCAISHGDLLSEVLLGLPMPSIASASLSYLKAAHSQALASGLQRQDAPVLGS